MISFAYKFGDQVPNNDDVDTLYHSSVTPFSSKSDKKSITKLESSNNNNQLSSSSLQSNRNDHYPTHQSPTHHSSDDNIIQLHDHKGGVIIYPCLSNTLKDTHSTVSKESINRLLCSVLQVRVNDDGIQLSVK